MRQKLPTSGQRKAGEVIKLGAALTVVPTPDLPLNEIAFNRYRELAKRLLDLGKLNIHTKAKCEQIAILHAEMHHRLQLNRSPSATAFEQINRAIKELQLVEDSDEKAPGPDQSGNRFARIGVIVSRGASPA